MGKYVRIKSKLTEVKAERAKSLSRKAAGLMFESKMYPLLFEFGYERQWSFHTFFVFKPIDFVFIDNEKRVVEVKYRVKPFTLCVKPSGKIKYALELPEGIGSLFRIGEKLYF